MLGIEWAEAFTVGFELVLQRHVVGQLPVFGELLELGTAILEVEVDLLFAHACVHVQHGTAVLVQRAVNAPQIREIEWEPGAVVEAEQECCDETALA